MPAPHLVAARLGLALLLTPVALAAQTADSAGAASAPAAVAAADAAAASAAPAAPAADGHLRDGRWLIEFSVPSVDYDRGDAGGALGFWNMISERTSVGADIDVGVRSQSGEESDDSTTYRSEYTTVQLGMTPGLRRYFETRRAVAAYAQLDLPLSISGNASGIMEERRQWSYAVGVGGYVGLNWFITDALSLSGGIGASLSYSRYEARAEGGPYGDRTTRSDALSFGLRSGELRLGLWF